MKDPAHLVIRASAGAGKTFTLSSRYLKLLIRGANPQQILATTFTRKAADEILSRVLLRAARGAADEAGARQLATDLKQPGIDLAAARDVLERLVRSLHAVSISTIDSFFNRIAQSFRMELDLPADAMLVAPAAPEAVQLRAQAIEAMLADDDPHVLIELLRRLHHDQAQRRVTDAIDDIVENLYETYRLSPHASTWSVLSPPPSLSEAQYGLALEAYSEFVGDAPESRWGARLAKPLRTLREAALRRDWEAFMCATLVQSLTTGDGAYYNKPIDANIVAALRPLIAHARAKLIERTAQRTGALHELLERFDLHYTRLRRLHRVQLFSDLPLKIGRDLLSGDDDAAADTLQSIYYRLDAQVHHLMLDEFQDTSIEQWNVLLPFGQEICAHGGGDFGSRTFFCVGDLKQAIYNWRGGCAELFAQVERDLQLDDTAGQTLSKSYRSSQVVLDVVNQVFREIATASPLADHVEVVAAWQRGFEVHTAAKNLPGYVELISSVAASNDDGRGVAASDDEGGEDGAAAADPHLVFAADKIAELAHGAPGRSIGVLVRTNATVNRLIYHLRRLQLPVSGEGGNLVTDDPAVAAVLSALTMADHPGHSAAAFHVLTSPLGPIVDLSSMARQDVAVVAGNIRRDLLTHGYAAVISSWVKKLAPSCDVRSVVRLTQLVELADRYDPAITLRTGDFVDYVNATPVEEPTSASIRVMTVHRAKGLEFDIVVMAELEPLLAQVHKQAVWTYRAGLTRPPAAVFAATNKQALAVMEAYCPQYGLAYDQEIARRLQDDLCGLYVAMTRARFALHLIVQPLHATKSGKPGTRGLSNLCCAAILRDRLGAADEGFAGNALLFEHGDPAWHRQLPVAAAIEAQTRAASLGAASLGVVLAPPRGGLGRSWPRISPSSLEGQGRVSAADLLAVEEHAGRQRGSVMHKFFEQIAWLNDDVVGDDQLIAAARQIDASLDGARLQEQIDQFRDMLQQPGVCESLAAPVLSDGEVAALWRERSFAVHVDHRLLRGTFDRVAIVYRDGRPVRAELLDFKTDQANASGGFVTAIERYRPQATAYRQALAVMLGLDAARIDARLLFVSRGALVRV